MNARARAAPPGPQRVAFSAPAITLADLVEMDGFGLERPGLFWVALAALVLLLILRERSRADHSPIASFLATLLRAGGAALVLLAIAGPWTEHQRPDRSLVVVVDHSASMTEAALTRADELARAIEGERAGEALTFVVSGARLAVDTRWDLARERAGAGSPGARTDLAEALFLALEHLPAARRREVILLSDGVDGVGRLALATRVAEARDVPIHTVALGGPPMGARIDSIEAPQAELLGTPLEVRVRGVALQAARVELVGPLGSIGANDVTPGPYDLAFSYTAAEAGTVELLARVTAAGDTAPWDDVAHLRLAVRAPPRALVVGRAESAAALRRAVAAVQPPLVVREDAALPEPPYDDVDLIVLLDPKLPSIGDTRGRALVEWVRRGGRLLVTGGPEGLVTDEPGAKAIAEILPLRFPKTKKEQRAPLAVVFLLDRSDSMAGGPKFEMAASALLQAAAALPPGARLGVVAFADFPEWVWPVQPWGGIDPVLEALRKVPVKGGTSIYPAIEAAASQLVDDPALVKHIVLLSDGQSTTRFQRSGDAVRHAADKQITVTTVSVGAEAERGEMEAIARAGKGRAHHAERFTDLPKLFLDEMMQVQRTNKVEERHSVLAVEGADMLKKLPQGELIPAIDGYVRGDQRGGSDLVLATNEGHPLLAAGHYGRGRTALFASDLGGPWTSQWRSWGAQGALWSGVVESILRSPPPPRTDLRVVRDGTLATVRYDVEDSMRNPLSGLVVELVAEDKAGTRRQALPATGPGRYGADLPLRGPTLLRVAPIGVVPGASAHLPSVGERWLSVEPGPTVEQRGGSDGAAALERVAEGSRGRHNPDVPALLGEKAEERTERVPRWRDAVALALVLWALDLLARRLRRLTLPGPKVYR